MRLVRLYQSEKGIWRYDIERHGIVHWSSLHTRDEAKARAAYERMRVKFDEYERAKIREKPHSDACEPHEL